MKYFGKYECEISDGRISLPDKFQMKNKDMMVLVLENKGVVFIKIYDVLIDEYRKMLIQSSVVLSEEKIRVDRDGSILLPKAFLKNSDAKKKTHVVVMGEGFTVDIRNVKDKDEFSLLIALINTPGESLKE